jgi:hypothetical protein
MQTWLGFVLYLSGATKVSDGFKVAAVARKLSRNDCDELQTMKKFLISSTKCEIHIRLSEYQLMISMPICYQQFARGPKQSKAQFWVWLYLPI